MKKRKQRQKHFTWPAWAVAGATFIFGLALLIKPDLTTNLILNILGGGLLVVGGYKIIRYFMHRDPYAAFSWDLILGAALVCGGLALLIFKRMLLSIVPLLFGIVLLICGVVKLQAAFSLRHMMNRRWYLTLAGAAVSCVLGLLIILYPFGTGLALVRLIGGSVAFEAVQDLLSLRSYDHTVQTYFVD